MPLNLDNYVSDITLHSTVRPETRVTTFTLKLFLISLSKHASLYEEQPRIIDHPIYSINTTSYVSYSN